ncbi:uncharacterized protein [Mobula birostris]|uniref:uncharacterized protein isoform X20 n=1 Tax=Mobula birostris TaxID=1983395 RepID=UPI003B27F927
MKFRAADIQGSLTLILLLGLRAVSAEFSLDCFYKWERDMEASGSAMEASGSAMEDMEASGSAMEELDSTETTAQDTNWRRYLTIGGIILLILVILIAAVSLRQRGSTCQTPWNYELTASNPP